jgi:hypothetical protein
MNKCKVCGGEILAGEQHACAGPIHPIHVEMLSELSKIRALLEKQGATVNPAPPVQTKAHMREKR